MDVVGYRCRRLRTSLDTEIVGYGNRWALMLTAEVVGYGSRWALMTLGTDDVGH